MTRQPRSARSRGFTLIELLIAVLIISILATLVTLGVTKAMSYAKQVANKVEMGQIEQALGVAALEMGRVPYIPSYIKLCNDKTRYLGTSYDQMSLRMLTQMFPNAWGVGLENWNGGTDGAAGIYELAADKAYVYFLSGMAGNGFSAKGPPTSTAPGTKRFGPYFDFKQSRLVPDAKGFSQYRDYWDNTNGFLVVYSQMMVGQSPPPFIDTPTTPPAPLRQFQSTAKYFQPKGYQIFSAGKDGIWGATGYGVTPFVGFVKNGDGLDADDQANFAEDLLGKPMD